MKGFDYEIKIENSPLNIGINLNGLKVKSIELPYLIIYSLDGKLKEMNSARKSLKESYNSEVDLMYDYEKIFKKKRLGSKQKSIKR